MTDDAYLVTLAAVPVVPKRLLATDGERVILDQELSPVSFVLCPGGRYRNEALLAGEIATASTDTQARSLCAAFIREVTRGFKRIQGFRVGPEAYALARRGFRLLKVGIREMPEYDLRLP